MLSFSLTIFTLTYIIDGLSELSPIRLISENDTIHKEKLDKGPETARPIVAPAEPEANLNATSLQPEQIQGPSSESIAKSPALAKPVTNSPETNLSPQPERNASSSQPKDIPPPLNLNITSSSGNLPSRKLSLLRHRKDPRLFLTFFYH